VSEPRLDCCSVELMDIWNFGSHYLDFNFSFSSFSQGLDSDCFSLSFFLPLSDWLCFLPETNFLGYLDFLFLFVLTCHIFSFAFR